MKLLLDACVLYPTVMREVLLGAARAGFYRPLWSERILEEWARAAARHGPLQETQARGEIAVARADFPDAVVPAAQAVETGLWLPDPADIHVLAAALAGSAERIVTLNRQDFPRRILARHGLDRIDPDSLLMQFWQEDAEAIEHVAAEVLATARRLSDPDWEMRPLLKKAKLPRLGKAVTR